MSVEMGVPFDTDATDSTKLLQGLISPADAQSLVPPPGRPLSARAEAAARKTAQAPELRSEMARATGRRQPVGRREPESGRVITQPTDNPAVNQALATDAMPGYRSALRSAVRAIPGAELAASRAAKRPARLAEKIARQGQPAETLNDYGAAQIAVDSPAAKDAVVAAVRKRFPVLIERDQFQNGDPRYGYRSHTLQAQMPNGASQELQVVPREVFAANREEHSIYRKARRAEPAGDRAGFERARARARARNDAAMRAFDARNRANAPLS